MKIKLANLWDATRSSFWFVPGLMVGAAVLLSIATLVIDYLSPLNRHMAIWLYSGDAEGARTILATLAASMITIFGVVFSIVIVALTLASSQFGPRLLRTFLRDTVDQVAVGTFISTFVYCILVLRTVRGDEPDSFVPDISVSTAILLSLFSLGVLIYFISHLSASLQASHVIAAVGSELDAVIDSEFLLPTEYAEAKPPTTDQIQAMIALTVTAVQATRRGYIQAIDRNALLAFAEQKQLVLRVMRRSGDFIVPGDTIALVSTISDSLKVELKSYINGAFLLGADRTNEQDVEFPINQLVQLAARSLSPAINDPITAMMAIEQLRAGLCRIADRRTPSPILLDSQGVARLLVTQQTTDHIAEAAFSLLRQFGRGNLEVTLTLLNAIREILNRTDDSLFRTALLREAEQIALDSQTGLPSKKDREAVANYYSQIES